MAKTIQVDLVGSYPCHHHVEETVAALSAAELDGAETVEICGSPRHEPSPLAVASLHHLLSKTSNIQCLRFLNVSFFGTKDDYDTITTPLRDCPTLTRVHIECCRPSELEPTKSLGLLLKWLAAAPNLTDVSICNTMISSMGFRTVQSLRSLIHLASRLQTLSLKRVPELGDNHLAQVIQQAIQPHPNLRNLTIESLDLGLATSVALADMLRLGHILKQLRLSLCSSLDHVLPLVQALRSPQADLEELVFHVDYFSERYGNRRHFLDATQDMLYSNYTLKTIRGISWGSSHQAIPFLLQMNRVGRGRLLRSGDDDQQSEWIEALIANRHSTRIVHYLLLSNPSLCRNTVATNC